MRGDKGAAARMRDGEMAYTRGLCFALLSLLLERLIVSVLIIIPVLGLKRRIYCTFEEATNRIFLCV